MREHAHEPDAIDLERPKADRAVEGAQARYAAAALAGRGDVVGRDGLLHLQRVAGNAALQRSPVLDVVGSGGGSALDEETRTEMEDRLGHDFSDVRVHTGGAADESARSVNAQAYTVGSDIVFASGRYDPSSDSGRHVLAHELTHVVQQRSGPVDGTETGDGVRVSDPSDRFEREASDNADRVMTQPAPATAAPAPETVAVPSAVPAVVPAAVQREAGVAEEDDEVPVQTFVQRAEDEDLAEE